MGSIPRYQTRRAPTKHLGLSAQGTPIRVRDSIAPGVRKRGKKGSGWPQQSDDPTSCSATPARQARRAPEAVRKIFNKSHFPFRSRACEDDIEPLLDAEQQMPQPTTLGRRGGTVSFPPLRADCTASADSAVAAWCRCIVCTCRDMYPTPCRSDETASGVKACRSQGGQTNELGYSNRKSIGERIALCRKGLSGHGA